MTLTTHKNKIIAALLVVAFVCLTMAPAVFARINNPGSSSGGGSTYSVADTTVTYPITNSGTAVGIAFGTTTSNTWAGLQTFTNASSTQFSVSGLSWFTGKVTTGAASTTDVTVSNFFAVPNSTVAPTAAGEIRVSADANQLKFFGTASRVLSPFSSPGFQYQATSTVLAGTTTEPLPVAIEAGQWDGASCYTDKGIWNVVFSVSGSASTTMIQASSTPGFISFSSNNTYSANVKRYVSIASTTQASAAPSILTCTLKDSKTGA